MAATIETELALIRYRLDQLVEGQERLASQSDALEARVDTHSRRFVAADAQAADLTHSATAVSPRRVQLLISAGSAGGGITLGLLAEKLLALLF